MDWIFLDSEFTVLDSWLDSDSLTLKSLDPDLWIRFEIRYLTIRILWI